MPRFSIAQAAEQVHVSAITLRRWEAEKKIPAAKRDRNGWRFYTSDDIANIKQFADSEREVA